MACTAAAAENVSTIDAGLRFVRPGVQSETRGQAVSWIAHAGSIKRYCTVYLGTVYSSRCLLCDNVGVSTHNGWHQVGSPWLVPVCVVCQRASKCVYSLMVSITRQATPL